MNTVLLRRQHFSSHLVVVACNHLLFLQEQSNFRRITACPENRYITKYNILKYAHLFSLE
ncbi:putative lipoprotein (plasmid) [Klebsiella variicola]|uniref:Putative lipoprotein n=1 Tax=Klebsiella variicola (strain 342) TaxID=507522 RepID=B5RJU7_KLEV3|nr:putative lipoprotein [Klebsiella variicola]